MENRKAKLIVNKSGGTAGAGGVTFRVTLPSSWIRKMKLDEDNRDIKLYFNGKEIIIENNTDEIMLIVEMIEKAKVKIEEEISKVGFIDDTDNADRFIDNLARELIEDAEIEFDDLLEELTEYMNKTYKRKGSVDETGHYAGCYYKDREGFKKWSEIGE